MELQYLGANCVRIATKKTSIVTDDNLESLGLKQAASSKDIVVSTGLSPLPTDIKFGIDQPGEYEVSDISIQGIAARAHMDEDNKQSATMYRIVIDGYRIAVVGHIHPKISESQLEALGTIDILIVPVGGNGYTLDGVGAQQVIKEIEPKVVIPVHYADSKITYEVPQAELDDALKGLSMEPVDRVDTLKMKNFDLGEGAAKLVIINRT